MTKRLVPVWLQPVPLPRLQSLMTGEARELYDLPLGDGECAASDLPNIADFYTEAGRKAPTNVPFQRLARHYQQVTQRIYEGETMTRVLINELLRENRQDPNKNRSARQQTTGALQALAEVTQQVKLTVNAEFQVLLGLGRERRQEKRAALNPWPILAGQESPHKKRLRLPLKQRESG